MRGAQWRSLLPNRGGPTKSCVCAYPPSGLVRFKRLSALEPSDLGHEKYTTRLPTVGGAFWYSAGCHSNPPGPAIASDLREVRPIQASSQPRTEHPLFFFFLSAFSYPPPHGNQKKIPSTELEYLSRPHLYGQVGPLSKSHANDFVGKIFSDKVECLRTL